MKKNLLWIALFLLGFGASAQTFLSEDFNGTWPPAGWTREGVPNQWSKSQTNNAGGTPAEAKFTYINQNTTSRLISPVIDLSGQTSLSFSFKHMYDWYANGVTIGAAYRFGTGDWQVIWSQLPTGNVGPETKIVELSGVGQSDFQFCFFISGNLYNADYWFIDDVKLFIPYALDAALTEVDIKPFVAINTPFNIEGMITNEGLEAITSFDVSYAIDGEAPVVYSLTGLNIPLGGTLDFTHPDPVVLSSSGAHVIVTTVGNINGGTDLNPDNNSITTNVSVVPFIPVKKVLAEEATGTWCGWCVRGICFMDYMAETYPETWIGVAVHNGDPMVYAPYDAAIGNIIPGFQGYPNVTTDRTAGNSDPSDLETAYNIRVNEISPATVDIVNFSWNPDARKVEFDLQSEFVANVEDELRFGVIVTEDSLWGTTSQWNQANYYAGGGNGPMCGFESMPGTIPAAQMHYDHVARIILDTPYGTPSSLPQPIAAGSVHAYSYALDIPETWNYDKLHFIGFLVNNTTGEILNANDVISDYVGVRELNDAISLNVYPNPAKDELNIGFELTSGTMVEIQVVDMMGKTVVYQPAVESAAGKQLVRMGTDALSNGTYILKLQAGDQLYVQKLMISK